MRPLAAFLLAVVLVQISSPAFSSLTTSQMDRIWENNGKVEGIQVFRYGVVDWTGRWVSAEGRFQPASHSAGDRLLAKRGAMADARRNLLCLLYEMKFGLPERLQAIDVTGEVVEGNMDFQGLKNGFFVVEVTVPLERFLSESLIFSSSVR